MDGGEGEAEKFIFVRPLKKKHWFSIEKLLGIKTDEIIQDE